MKQKSIGEVLRDTRESRGWDFLDIQQMTKIQAKYVQALEYNDFDAIPDQDYTRSFLQRYADILELDAAVLLDAYDTGSLVIYYDAGEAPRSQTEFRRNLKKKKSRKSYLPLVYLLLAAIFILIFVAYIVSERIQNQAISPTPSSYSVVSESTSTTEDSSSEPTETSSSSTPASSSQEPSSSLTVTGGGAELAVALSGAATPVELSLSVTEATSWISVTDTDLAGGTVLSPENTSVTVTIPEGVTRTTLTLGVVEGVTISIAGQNVDTSALTSQTGYITLTIE